MHSDGRRTRVQKFPEIRIRREWNCFVELIHPTRDVWEEEAHTVIGKVQLVRTEPTFGGHRWWFLCPKSGYRATKLFLPNGGRHFWSRRAYRLGYACLRENPFSRLQRRAATLDRGYGERWRKADSAIILPIGVRR